MPRRRVPGRARCFGVLVAVAVTLTACVHNTEGLVPPDTVHVDRVDSIAAQVPAPVAQNGRLRIGVNVPYAPNEFKDENGNIVGFDVDLMNAVAAVLGVRAEFIQADFDKIIPAVQAGTYDLGMSSFTDTLERQKSVDFVDYYLAGVQWAQQTGEPVDPNNACGLRVGVQTTTYEDIDEVPAKSADCVAAGRPPIAKIKYDSQDDVSNALILGRVDAMSADSPVTAYAVKRSDGRLENAGEQFDSAPYGWPVPKGSPLAPVLVQALQHLIDSGAYQQIADNWGVGSGTVTTAQINGATS
ncbi:ABC transporter substrate-binding protein [Rhodococcus sp. NPDC003318]|uniref:ABC transporter substrate-binding protein n=1 Tax=Rhodococcus sp. NPDC003318 TaxID=3364503 RepID=UPI00367FD000